MRSTYSKPIKKFSLLTRLLHWSIFLLFTLQFFLVYRREYFPKDTPEKLQYILLHKSVGVLLLILALLFVIWIQIRQRPTWPRQMPSWQRLLAKFTHLGLIVSMLLMPLSGIFMSMYGGKAISVFGQYTLPMLVEQNKAIGGIIYNVHVYTSYAVLIFVSLHVLAALTHHFIYRDNVLKNMI